MNALLVEDDVVNRTLMTRLLANRGHQVTAVETGEEAWESFQNNSFSLVILDWVLPGMSGLDLCKKIRLHSQRENCYVLLFTANDDPQALEQVLNAGANDYVLKPANTKVMNIRLAVAEKQVHHLIERNQAEDRLRLTNTVFENSVEGIVITDHKNKIIFTNKAFTRVTGYTQQEVIGQNPNMLKSGLQGSDFYRKMWQLLQQNGHWQGEIWNRRKNGEVYPEILNISIVKDSEGKTTNYVAVFSDITSSKQTEERLHFLSHHDPLTRLPNRNQFQQLVEHGLVQAKRLSEKVAVFFLDLDRFKIINDTLGHGFGDKLLQAFAQKLKQIMGDEHTTARMGGDEYAVLLEGFTNINEIINHAQAIINSLEEPFVIEGKDIYVTTSIGISLYPTDSKDARDLIKNADTAMNQAKEAGKNTYHFFTPEQNLHAFERLNLENSLRKALERNELRIFFQPQIEAATGLVIGAEALLRWEHPEMGLIAPARFVPLAEETGLIVPIGTWVLNEVCKKSMEYKSKGYAPIRLAVNLSARQFHEKDFVDTVSRAINTSGINPGLLELEITESVVMKRAEDVIAKLNELKSLGIGLSVDDFGTGFSSLSYLKRFPLDMLKIDQSFVNDVMENKDDEAIISAIIALAKSMKLKTIAEGVETHAQYEYLKNKGCDYIQGFLFSRPLPQDVFEDIMKKDPEKRHLLETE